MKLRFAPVAATMSAALMLSFSASPVFAQSKSAHGIDSGNTAWLLIATALVFLMTPGLALFYGGMVRSKNVVSVLMQSFVACGLITLQWIFFGYSLAFGPDRGGLIGNLSWACLHGVSAFTGSVYAPTVPHQLYCMFQMMFALITPALISGAVVERMKFSAYLLFMLLWATFVYDPLTHWVWGQGGWLGHAHVLDMAGGSVVEMASGFSALTLTLLLGHRRRSLMSEEMRPHNLPLTVLGTGVLWFGWFGFNAGSANGAGQVAANTFVTSHLAGATAAMTWLLLDWLIYKKPTALGFCSGVVAGLVAITPACGFVTPGAGAGIGVLAGAFCFWAIRLKHQMKADDSLDVFGVHGCGGLLGCLATGLFATISVNSAGHNGWINGGSFATSMIPQLLEIVATLALTVIGTIVIAIIVKTICGGLRSTADDEENGLDLADHGEQAYGSEVLALPYRFGAN